MDRRAIAAIEKLPELARSRLRDLELMRMAAEDASRAAAGRLSGLPRDADPQMHERLADERDKQGRRGAALSQLCNRLMQFLAELPPNTVLEMMPTPPVELNGKPAADAIAAVRNEIAALRGRLAAVRRAALSKDEQLALVKSYASRLLNQARPRVSIVGDQLKVNWRGDTAMIEDVAALLCWLQPTEFVEALQHELGQPAAGAISSAERSQRICDLEAQLYALAVREEKLIELAQADGVEILRRPDANPLCVLGVVVKETVQAVA
jgi:hypothetical protein